MMKLLKIIWYIYLKIIPHINKKFKLSVKRFLKLTGILRLLLDTISFISNYIPREKFEEIYSPSYHKSHGYDSEEDFKIKKTQAIELCRLFSPKKVLVAGCSMGNAIIAFREIGVEAYGFDLNIDNCLPSAKQFIRRGSLLKIPFNDSDGFDLLVCTDVLEHIRMRDIPRVIEEIYKLKIKWLAAIINHEQISIGHVTLKPLKWWIRQFDKKFKLHPEIKTKAYVGIYGLDPKGNACFTFWERVDSTPTSRVTN